MEKLILIIGIPILVVYEIIKIAILIKIWFEDQKRDKIMKLKQLFCKHEYKKIAKRKSNYCSDYVMFSDLGDYEDVLYACKKCKKTKIEIINKHFYHEWEKVDQKGYRV